MKKKYYLVDVFTKKLFGGNPLAVFPQAEDLSEELMQKIANELNLSETTFVFLPQKSKNNCRVRIFTPRSELPFAGHPTIGTTFVLLQQKIIEPKNETYLVFEEGIGEINVEFQMQNCFPELITMSQPLPRFGALFDNVNRLAEMLSLQPDQLNIDYPAQAVSCGLPTLLVPIRTLTAIKSIKLKLDLWERYLTDFETQQIMVFTTETEETESDVHTRFFAPALGIYEDPATGAASGPLGCYLVKYNLIDSKENKRIISEQGYEMRRKSRIYIQIETKNSKIVSVKVSGKCISVGEGIMRFHK